MDKTFAFVTGIITGIFAVYGAAYVSTRLEENELHRIEKEVHARQATNEEAMNDGKENKAS